MSNRTTRPPLIGVSGCRKIIDGHPFDAAGRKYTSAIEDGCEALPLIIPATGDKLDREALLARVDGLMFTGSYSNVEPRHYDGEQSQEGTLHDPYRDATTLPLIREAVAAGVPVFCICRGFQEMVVAYGGSLYQRVHEVESFMDHREDTSLDMDQRYAPVHAVQFNPDGVFKHFIPEPEAQVNSLHEQGAKSLSDALLWEAKAPDGLVEAISVRNAKTFACAVQWHPEWKVTKNPFYLKLFHAFATACREYMDKPSKQV